ncbi:hypothetical protein BE04_41800 [Sorangium cellulosum]|uniref:PE-PGRS family protein n=1 Tax=Sorangium cellulosum TaxID=56 RepID=A0A150PEM1_SORCE|nr:hypothetical protein BE04_41800 [Sorangium cellulosum]
MFADANATRGGDGTRERPFVSLQDAVYYAAGRAVLVCRDGVFNESVTIDAGIEVVGGFDCAADWTWRASAWSTIEAPPDEVALTITDRGNGAKVRNFAIRAASARIAGGSSIGVAAADVVAELLQVDVVAGDALDGAHGETPFEAPDPGENAPLDASNACVIASEVRGAEPGVTVCEDGETRGGDGGRGALPDRDVHGQRGGDGTPLPEPNPDNRGLGGAGQSEPIRSCGHGTNGANGAPGEAGAAGLGSTLALTGVIGGKGGDGKPGRRGQGGGGGGSAMPGRFCLDGSNVVAGPGASGGGGGAGGCGGKGGQGGQAGGSSIGLLNLGARVVLNDVTVAVGKGGKGGDGATGRGGGLGGSGGIGGEASGLENSIRGCRGGHGGHGGDGGPGGGGRGGHAVGIAYAYAPPPDWTGLKRFVQGMAGDGGSGGPGAPAESAGMPGVSGPCWNFGANEPCDGSP